MKEIFRKPVEWLKHPKETLVKWNKNWQMIEARGILLGLTLVPGLLAPALGAYGVDRITNRFTKRFVDPDGSKNRSIYREDDTIGNDFLQAIWPQWLASPRMARAAA